MARILIVEDNEELLALVSDFFRSKGSFDVDTAPDGNCALSFISVNEYDLAILDIMLPGTNGFDVCKALRGKSKCPIVFLTALGTEENILRGYEIGADEYMVKPFSLKVLYAKCLALLNRTHDSDDSQGEIVVVNTCGFINDAKEESINTILEFAQAKTEGRIEKLYVMGCLSERYLADLEQEIPEVDGW